MSPRTAEEIGRTAIGARPVPPMSLTGKIRAPSLQRAELDSGLTVIAARKPRSPLVEVRLRVPFGGTSRVHAARAEMLAATMLLGTGSRDREQVDAELALVGGHLDASVDPQRLMITGSVLSTGLPVLLAVLADCLTDAAYRRSDVVGERERLVEHLAISATQPSSVAHRFLQERRFGEHPAAWDTPEPELVAAVGPAVLRRLHERSLVPRGSTLVLVGDLSPTRAVDIAGAALAGWTADPAVTARGLKPPPAVVGDTLLAHHRPGAVQSQIRLSGAAVTRHDPSYPAHQLANLVYGGYFSSRLVENIREDKGYTYSARSSLEFWPQSAAVSIAFDTTTPSTAPALLEARYELGRISLVAPTADEVESARNYALGTLATSLSTQSGLASTLSMLAGTGLDESWLKHHPVALAAVTVDEVAAAAADMLAPARFTGVVVGDVGVLESQLRGLGDVDFA
ncbi:M16 family metallopeptidase [Nakamurella sp. GG22]